MAHTLRKHFWAVHLLTIAVCAFFAGKGLSRYAASKLPQPKRAPTAAVSYEPLTPSGPPARDTAAVAGRNMFCSTCEAVAEIAGTKTPSTDEKAAPASNEPVKSSLNLKLIATMVSDQDKAFSYAAIFDPTADKTGMYAIASRLQEATIVDIYERRVILRNGGRNEYLELDSGDTPPAVAAAPGAAPIVVQPRPMAMDTEGLEGGVRKTGDGKWEIQRSALNKVLGNTTMLARSARIVPSVRNNKPDGFKLYAIRPGSVYSLIGMENGDTIHAINGYAMDTPDKALEVYTKVRTASHLTISFSRGGKAMTHDYTIR